MRRPWKRRPKAPAVRRPDYTAIAVLEHDLFGIQPKPGTTAAAIIGMRRLGRLASAGAATSSAYVGPEYGAGLVGRPSPYLLEPGERILPLRSR
jgi:hypothetical protein